MLPIALATLQRIEFPRKLGLLAMLYGRKLAARGTTWIQTSRGITWKLDLRDACHRWIVYGYYEGPAIWRWLRGWLRDGDLVVDSVMTVVIQQTALDELLGDERPSLLKIGVDGFEVPLLRRARRTRRDDRLRSDIVEVNNSGSRCGYDAAGLFELLRANGVPSV